MGQIEIKVLDEKSLAARKFIVDSMVNDAVSEISPNDERYDLLRKVEEFTYNSSLRLLFDNKAPELKKILQKELQSDNIPVDEMNALTLVLEPIIEIRVVEDKREGPQGPARIEWDGEIRKIDNILEIISYKFL